MDALVHNSFISECVCPPYSLLCILFISLPCFPSSLSLPLSLFSLHLPLFQSLPPPLAPLHFPIIIISISLTISLSPSVPSYEIKYESIIHSFKHIYHRRVQRRAPYLQSFFSLCFGYSRLIQPHLKTPQHWGVFFSGASTDKSGSWGSKNPFRGFSCHNNSSASLK